MSTEYNGRLTAGIANPPQAFEETGFAGSENAVCLCDSTTPDEIGPRTKAFLITILAAFWHRWPALGVALGRLVLAAWRGFMEA